MRATGAVSRLCLAEALKGCSREGSEDYAVTFLLGSAGTSRPDFLEAIEL